jgi:FtsZ-binding cell division protein ZapB
MSKGDIDTPEPLSEVDELKEEIKVLKDQVSDLQLAIKSVDHDLQATKREMEG